jgi:hypothetical protein
MYESATEHTKALVLTAPVQRFQRIAELNRRSCVGEFDHRAVPYQIVGCSKRHASIPIGQTERIYALTLESILLFVKILRSPIGSHMKKAPLYRRVLEQMGEKSAVLYQRFAPTSLSLANCVCLYRYQETGSAAPCHDTFQSICDEVPRDSEQKGSRSVWCVMSLPCSCLCFVPRGASLLSPFLLYRIGASSTVKRHARHTMA